jgi:hypothetical protein
MSLKREKIAQTIFRLLWSIPESKCWEYVWIATSSISCIPGARGFHSTAAMATAIHASIAYEQFCQPRLWQAYSVTVTNVSNILSKF